MICTWIWRRTWRVLIWLEYESRTRNRVRS
jgi:hypothetical protein